MAKFITRGNPYSILKAKVFDIKTELPAIKEYKVLDIPADGKNPARRAAFIKKTVQPDILLNVLSVTPCSGTYRMAQVDFLANAEFIDKDIADVDDGDDETDS